MKGDVRVLRIKLPDGKALYVALPPRLRSGKPHNNRENRERLWRIDPRCHWCALVTVPVPGDGKPLQHFHATLDHVYSAQSERRDEVVLACHGCNQKRAYIYGETFKRRSFDPERRANTIRLMAEHASLQSS